MSNAAPESVPSEKTIEVRYEFTPVLADILSHLNASLMVTTYQAGKLLVLGVHNGSLKISFANYEQPMGLAVQGDRLAIGTRRQINFLVGNRDVAPSVIPAGTWDVCYVPRTSSWTGNIHGHDLAWGRDGLWVVNTLFSCLCSLHEDYSFVPQWRPPFISQLADQDRCHLNGLALEQGQPRFVTAMAESDTPAGWRPTKATSGVIIDVPSGETVARGLAMPHSPRWHDGKLWVLDSGRGALCTVDLKTGNVETVETFPGYTRGLSFLGQFAFVGLSQIRETSVFGGVPIAERKSELRCGVGVVDLLTGRTVAVFQFHSGVSEIFAVEVAAGAACPYVSGASTEGAEHDVWIVPYPNSVPSVQLRRPWFAAAAEKVDRPARPMSDVTGAGSSTAIAERGRQSEPENRISENPRTAAGWVDLGNLRQEQNRQAEALICYERAVDADPAMSAARQNLGYLLFNQGFPEKARSVYRELLALDPSPMNRLLSASVLPVVYESKTELEQWRHEQLGSLQSLVKEGVTIDATRQLVPTAFFWAYQGCNDVEIMKLRGAIMRGRTNLPETASIASRDGRLRIGFLSAYFRNHTIGRLNAGRIERLDRTRFHVTVCYAGTEHDNFTARFQAAADKFVNVPRAVPQAMECLDRLELDMLVFADVGMDALCSTLAFSRFAPVQCATWGHPETTGSDAIDYFLSSELLDEEAADAHYSETLVRMPLMGTCYERPTPPEPSSDVRTTLGLPEGRSLYACPQSLFKFHPDDDEVIRGILEKDPQGVLVVIEGRVAAWTERLRSRWERTLGSAAKRVKYLPALSHENYLRLLQTCDVMLDPLHFGGGNSSYEALAMGTPIVTMPSPFLRGRITNALYARMQWTKCVVYTKDDYVREAVRIATDKAHQQSLRSQILERASILFECKAEIDCLETTLLNLRRRPVF